MCQDASCIIFKFLEQLNLGAKVKRPLVDDKMQQLAISFVDDIDFFASNRFFIIDVQLIMNYCMKLHEATEGRVQQSKIMFYCWKWVHRNGEKIFQ